MKATIGLAILLHFNLLFSWNHLSAQENIFTDDRDGQQYKMITIKRKTWMAENLNYETQNSYVYGNKKRYANHFGKLYTWDAAMIACPSGWHLPNAGEWQELIDFFGGELRAGLALRIDGTSSFNADYAGFMNENGEFLDLGNCVNYWTATSCDEKDAWRCFIDRGFNTVVQDYFGKNSALSVRCILDN